MTVFYKGSHVEVLVDILPGRLLSAESLLVYRRSSSLQLIKSATREDPYHSLKNVDPKPLWNFPGHPTIRDDWFKQFLLFDSGEYDLIVTADLAEDSQSDRDPTGQYQAGEFIVPAGLRLVICETAFVWSINPNETISETIVEWENIVDLKSRKVS